MSERSDLPIVSSVPVAEEPPKSGVHERRTGVRYPFTAAADVYDVRSKTRVTGRCSDLGSGGCYVDTLSPFTVGAIVKVRVERNSREFEAAAVVAYAHMQLGMGLAFTEIKPEHQVVLRSWIAGLSGEQPVETEVSKAEFAPAAIGDDANMRFVLNELITLLVRRKIISDTEGADLLRQLFR